MEKPKVIKNITPAKCPHCEQSIFINHQMIQPVVAWILKETDIQQAKKDMLKAAETIPFKDEEEKKAFVEWVQDENTLFGPEEVGSIIESAKQQQE